LWRLAVGFRGYSRGYGYRLVTAKVREFAIAGGGAVRSPEYDREHTKIAFRIHCTGKSECGSSSPHVHGNFCDEKAGYHCSDSWGKWAAGGRERVSSSERRPFWSVRRFSFPAWSTHHRTCSSVIIVNDYGHPSQIQATRYSATPLDARPNDSTRIELSRHRETWLRIINPACRAIAMKGKSFLVAVTVV